MTPHIAYRSPSGRVQTWSATGLLLADLDGDEAAAEWSRLPDEIKHDNAVWLDRHGPWRAVTRDQLELFGGEE